MTELVLFCVALVLFVAVNLDVRRILRRRDGGPIHDVDRELAAASALQRHVDREAR